MSRIAKIKIRRGLESNLTPGTLDDGEFGFTTDTKKLYVGLGGQNVLLVNTTTSGDMQKGIYDTDNDGIVDWAEKVEWSGVQNKPPIVTLSSTAPTTPNAGDFWYQVL